MLSAWDSIVFMYVRIHIYAQSTHLHASLWAHLLAFTWTCVSAHLSSSVHTVRIYSYSLYFNRNDFLVPLCRCKSLCSVILFCIILTYCGVLRYCTVLISHTHTCRTQVLHYSGNWGRQRSGYRCKCLCCFVWQQGTHREEETWESSWELWTRKKRWIHNQVWIRFGYDWNGPRIPWQHRPLPCLVHWKSDSHWFTASKGVCLCVWTMAR